MRKRGEIKRLVARIGTLCYMLDCGPTTVHRRLKDDPDFPQPWRDSAQGDLQWLVQEIEEYALRKAAARHAAPTDQEACAPAGTVAAPLEQRSAARPMHDVKPAAQRSPPPKVRRPGGPR